MNISIISIGNRLPQWAKLASQDYIKRFPKPYVAQLNEIPTPNRNAFTIEQAKALEWDKMQRLLRPNMGVITLDETGAQWTTRQLSHALNDWFLQFKSLAFLIGGPDGLAHESKKQSHATWSLSKLTLPHALARVLVLEQLYRSISLLNHHPYHRD